MSSNYSTTNNYTTCKFLTFLLFIFSSILTLQNVLKMATVMAESAQPEKLSKSYGQFLNELEPGIRTCIRKHEKIVLKINKLQTSVVFNETCIKENILPKYTLFKLHDPAAKREDSTTEFRQKLILRQITSAKEEIERLEIESEEQENLLKSKLTVETLNQIKSYLEQIVSKADLQHRLKITRKLCKLYNGDILLPNKNEKYINLSDYPLTKEQKEFLNLGPNCHLKSKFNPLKKKTELEILYQSALQLEADEKVKLHPNLRDLLRAEGLKNRSPRNNNQSILTKQLREAANELKKNPDITIRRADKANTYVVLNKEDYLAKIQHILSDKTKFQKLNKNTENKNI